jgi:Fe-S-cluster-containing dehydrogenase component
MDKQRRKFLKIAGAAALAGISAPTVAKFTATPAFAAAAKDSGAHGEEKPSGIRYGMLIDMRKLYGNPELMDKAIHACHSVHNVPHFEEAKNEIKWIWKTPFENAFTDHSVTHSSKSIKENDFLVLCNHCNNPPCVRVCPTKATYKLPNGIVAMDYHRCIGCRFCMMGCPYGARSFNWFDPREKIKAYNPDFASRTRGVVEKCNFCGERLALGQEPACVEALQESGAIVFGDLNDPQSAIRQILDKEYTIQRKPTLGTQPSIFYIV